jgi:hypothetical protein
LPQKKGCSKMYKWDDVPDLRACDFCAEADQCAEDGMQLYIEACIVPEPEESSSECDSSVVE